jgi:outer membrane protein OmpA-like peptidoglycan-associated protein
MIRFRQVVLVCVLSCVALLAWRNAYADDPQPHFSLEPGLVVVMAAHFNGMDFEVYRTLAAIDADIITYKLHRTVPKGATNGDLETLDLTYMTRRVDLETANRLLGFIHGEDPQLMPGSTGTQASSSLLAQLKSGAETPIIFGMAAGPLGSWGARKYYRGNMQRVSEEPVPVSVILNGARVGLATIHVRGRLSVGNDFGDAEFWFFDQSDYAIALRWTFKDSVIQVVRIDTPTVTAAADANRVATALASPACRAELHGIYFDVASADLLPASETALTVVADLLKSNPEWTIVVEGHTDNTGADVDNQTLSERRAAAVRAALVDRFAVGAERLTASGFGETRPLETNETIEGRARNRRVELSRTCP